MNITVRPRPKHGCNSCIWWDQHGSSPWGTCVLFHEKSWFEHGPCDEYELDPVLVEETTIEVDESEL